MNLNAGEEYEKRRRIAEAAYSQWQGQSGTYSIAALALAVLLVWSIVQLARGAGGFLLPSAALIGVAVCGVILARARTRSGRALRLLSLHEYALERTTGRKTQTGHTGEAFAKKDHLYVRDLHVIGPDSLFGMLATTRTAVGQAALADWLLQGVNADEARRRQAAVQELTSAYDLREEIALLGHSAFEELPAERFGRWLTAEAGGFPKWLRPVLLVLTSFWLLALIAGLLLHLERDVLVRNVAALIAVQGALCLRFRAEVREELELAERLAGQTAILRRGLQLLRTPVFASEALQRLQASVARENDTTLGQLERLLVMVEQRAKEWYYAPALLLGVGTHAAVGLRRWKRDHAADMHLWLRAWSEFDALLALSTYAAEHPGNVYPEIIDTAETNAAVFQAEALIHPLLPPDAAVANDIALGGEARFLLISGSNMAGKSTLLRAVGANAVLGLAGLPIPARSCRMSALRIGASLAVADSLAERKSKFLAEVERLRAIVTLAEGNRGTTLFLIDEIFSGTNSQDRKAAGGAVLRALLAAGASGALSTHDLTLTELADVPGWHGRNVHMASPDEDDPLGFDYKLKPGINQTTNAMAIVRMLGL